MWHRFFVGLAVAAIAALPATALAADTARLKFAFPAPPMSFVNTKGMTPWIKDVEAAAAGTLKIKLFAGPVLGDFRNIYDRTLNKVADISFGIFGPLAGQFRMVQVSSLPFETRNTTEAAVALWRLYEKGVIASEFGKVKVLALFNFPSSHVHTTKPIKTLDDLKGLKFSVSTREIGKIVQRLGGAPVPMPPPEIYQSMSRGLINGIVTSWTAVKTFKLAEVTNYHIEAPLGMSPAFVFMNKASYAGLPAKAKQAIDRFSGEPFSRRLGKEIDRAAAGTSKRVAAMKGHVVTDIPDNQVDLWKSRIKSVVDGWAKGAPNRDKVLAAFREEIKRVRAGM